MSIFTPFTATPYSRGPAGPENGLTGILGLWVLTGSGSGLLYGTLSTLRYSMSTRGTVGNSPSALPLNQSSAYSNLNR